MLTKKRNLGWGETRM